MAFRRDQPGLREAGGGWGAAVRAARDADSMGSVLAG
jgi:hypothetical protein